MPFFKAIEPNLKGRDFVVGDIHGTYSLLDQAMRSVHFDPAADRVISVGDLIDRGPESPRCLEFLRQPWFFALRGNHEDMLLDMFSGGSCDRQKLMAQLGNGMHWILTTPPPVLDDIIAEIRKLPIVMQMETPRGLVRFVHADVPENMNWKAFAARVKLGDPQTIHTALWGRDRIRSENEDGVAGIDRVFVGHTVIASGLRRFGNVYAVDTGAVFRGMGLLQDGHLTMTNVMASTAHMNAAPLSGPVDVRDASPFDPSRPFGNYAKPTLDQG